jgi:hypothetical protein
MQTGEVQQWVAESSGKSNGDFAPNGSWIADEADVSGRTEIQARDFPRGSDRIDVSVGGGSHPEWSHDGSRLYYHSRERSEMMAVDVEWIEGRPSFGRPRVLFGVRSRDGFDVFPDGRGFLLLREVPETREGALVLVQNWEALAR